MNSLILRGDEFFNCNIFKLGFGYAILVKLEGIRMPPFIHYPFTQEINTCERLMRSIRKIHSLKPISLIYTCVSLR